MAVSVTSVTFEPPVIRTGQSGDNWCITWAADGEQYVSMDDGYGWTEPEAQWKNFHNNRIYRISGGPDLKSFLAEELAGAPIYTQAARPRQRPAVKTAKTGDRWNWWSWYAYGIVSIDGNLYQFISHTAQIHGFGAFDGCQLIWRPKQQSGWKRWNGTDACDGDRWFAGKGGNQLLFFDEPNYAFSWITVAQFGQDYRENTDGYVYLYSPNGRWHSNQLNMARVRKSDILVRSKYEYFVRRKPDGRAEWVKNDINRRGIVHTFPAGWGWYSWSPSVVWNKQLGLFVMAAAGTQKQDTSSMHEQTGSLMLLWAQKPWGPWHQFYYDELWDGDDPNNRLYEPQLSPKWIYDNGRTMYLIYSDARDHWTTNYKWNMQKITLHVNDESVKE